MLSQFQIVGPNGVIKCSIPTQKKTRKGLYKNVRIDYSENWQDEQWKSIENAYKKSPFFQFYNYKIEPIFKMKTENLLDYNLALNEIIITCLKADFNPEIDQETEKFYSDTESEIVPRYPQVYDTKLGFKNNLSILDLLFNLGPETLDYLYSDISS